MLKMTLRWWVWGGALAACLMLAAGQLAGRAARSAPARAAAPKAVEPARQTAGAPAPVPVAPRPPAAQSLYAVELAVQQARARGDGENQAYRLRAAALSAQTIAMLTEREQAQMQWKLRVQAWQAERATLNPIDAAALRQRRFSAQEQTQLDAAEHSGEPKLILDAQ